MNKKNLVLSLGMLCCSVSTIARADYRADIGFTALQNALGGSTPTGANIKVDQVEAPTGTGADSKEKYRPDTSLFPGKTFNTDPNASTEASGHATGVGQLFYGSTSIAPGITRIDSYAVNGWANTLYTNTGATAAVTSRIANHSWVGNGNTPTDTGLILRMVDRQVQRNEYIQVVGMNNATADSPLLGSAYNVIAVGRTDGNHDHGSDAVSGDSVYVAGRTRPDLVAPQGTTSAATPVVSAAAALLVETGNQGAGILSNGSTSIAGVGTVYNAERSETVKAALMAGADRQTSNTSTSANISDYRSSGHQTANGLDDRFGAGQVNINNSYQILAAGEQDSAEDGGSNSGAIGTDGFDYDPSFGGFAGSNRTGTYRFDAASDSTLTATLVWNLGVANNDTFATTLHDLNLAMFDVTNQTTVASSNSTLDNTENLWVQLFSGHQYELRVTTPETANFSWDYALAWHLAPTTSPVPIPAAVWLFGSALAGLGVIGRRRSA